MAQELERPRITEIHVRMDCNGCVQKIKRAFHGISGIYDFYIDFPNQKLTVVGWADPEKIVKAIKKTRKTATICSHTEPPDPAAQPPEQSPEGGAPPSDSANPPPQEAPPIEPPKDAAAPPPESSPPSPAEHPNSQPDNNKREGHPSQDGHQPPAPPPAGHQPPSRPNDVGEGHVFYHHPPPPEYGYGYGYGRNFIGDHWYVSYPRGQEFQQEYWQPPPVQHAAPLHPPPPPPQPQPQSAYVTHSYNTYRPSPYVTEYHDYGRPRSPPPQPQYRYYSPPRNYQLAADQEYNYYNYPHHYHSGDGGSNNGNVASFFSDENPNACRIM